MRFWTRTVDSPAEIMFLGLLVLVCLCQSVPLGNNGEEDTQEFLGPQDSQVLQDEADMQADQEDVGQDESNSITGQMSAASPSFHNHSAANSSKAMTNMDYLRIMKRNREKDADDDRDKESWKLRIMERVLQQVGRINSTMTSKIDIDSLNISTVLPNGSQTDENFITEKIRSFYPSCDLPKNTDQEVWKNENELNLFFNFDQIEGNIATATLRLYRALNESSTNPKNISCPTSEEERLYRISTFFYTKPLKKHKIIKRKLSDSKVISDKVKWVELSVRPAARAWTSGRNLGLAILVEDQDENVLRADTFFRGAACMVGASTPKPIPTIIHDKALELDRLGGFLRQGGEAAVYNSAPLLPTVDVCTLEVPKNFTGIPDLSSLRACSLPQMHEDNLKQKKREQKQQQQLELSSLHHHLRHQHHRSFDDAEDPRRLIVGQKVIMTNADLQNYNHFDSSNSSFETR